jgi:hypothetical protein
MCNLYEYDMTPEVTQQWTVVLATVTMEGVTWTAAQEPKKPRPHQV